MAMTNFGTNDSVGSQTVVEVVSATPGTTTTGVLLGARVFSLYTTWGNYGIQRGSHDSARLSISRSGPHCSCRSHSNLRGGAQAGIDNKKGWSRQHRHACILGARRTLMMYPVLSELVTIVEGCT